MRNYQKPVLEEKTTSFFEVVNMHSGGQDLAEDVIVTPTPISTCPNNRKHVNHLNRNTIHSITSLVVNIRGCRAKLNDGSKKKGSITWQFI